MSHNLSLGRLMTETYVIHAKTPNSMMSVATQSPFDALERAREMEGPNSYVTITDRDGNLHTVAELEANVLSGNYASPDSSRRA